MVKTMLLLCTMMLTSCIQDQGKTPDGRRYKLVEICTSGHFDFDDDWQCDSSKTDTTWITERRF